MKKKEIKAMSEFIASAAIDGNELAANYLSQQSKILIGKAVARIAGELFPTLQWGGNFFTADESAESFEISHTVVKFLEKGHIEY